MKPTQHELLQLIVTLYARGVHIHLKEGELDVRPSASELGRRVRDRLKDEPELEEALREYLTGTEIQADESTDSQTDSQSTGPCETETETETETEADATPKVMSVDEYLRECEMYGVSVYITDGVLMVRASNASSLDTLTRLQRLLETNRELYEQVHALCEAEAFPKEPEPLVKFEYPSMAKCTASSRAARRLYSEMCAKQYGVPYHILFERTEDKERSYELLEASGLIERCKPDKRYKRDVWSGYYVLVWNEAECQRARDEYDLTSAAKRTASGFVGEGV